MKSIIIFCIMLSLSVYIYGQTFLSEDFSSGEMPPEGWTIDNQSNAWTISNTSFANGSAPELKMSNGSSFGTTRLISPEIDMTDCYSAALEFNIFFNCNLTETVFLGVSTRSGGGAWNDVWKVLPSGNIGPQGKAFVISNLDMGQPDFQLCFFVDGDLNLFGQLYIDDIHLYKTYNSDAKLVSINVPDFTTSGTAVSGTVINLGNDFISGMDVSWEVNGEVHTSSLYGLNIPQGVEYSFTCDDNIILPPGETYNITVTIDQVNGGADENMSNNSQSKDINILCNTESKKLIFEQFTSCNCGPCAGFNISFVPWCNNHDDEITVLKYQVMDDPYQIQDCNIRSSYYGVFGIPWLGADGKFISTNVSSAQMALNQALASYSIMKIISSHTLDNMEMTIDLTILPYFDVEDVKLQVAVFEYETTQNTGSNGELSFQHVLMKMVPDANGTVIDLIDRQPYNISLTVDLENSNVEEWDDLGVVIFCQDDNTKNIYQSEYSTENANFSDEARLSSISVNGIPVENFDPDTYSYNITISGNNPPLIEATLMDENGVKIIIPTYQLPGTAHIETFAENLTTHLDYQLNFTLTGIESGENITPIDIYPNPTNGLIYLKGAELFDEIIVYDHSGKIIKKGEISISVNKIDLSKLDNGIYFITAKKDVSKITKKIVLLK